jgi:hypothetical protein
LVGGVAELVVVATVWGDIEMELVLSVLEIQCFGVRLGELVGVAAALVGPVPVAAWTAEAKQKK